MLAKLTGRGVDERLAGSLALALLALQGGATILRVHDVKETRDVIAVWQAFRVRAAMRKYFGTDGVRGTVGQSPMTPDFVLRLGYAAGKVLAGQRNRNPAVLIGKDTRISGYMIESALEAGFPRRASTCTCAARCRRRRSRTSRARCA